MAQDVSKVANTYNSIAKKWTEVFAGEHDKKPMDQEILRRFVMEIRDRKPVWEFGCGPGHTTRFLTDLGLDISGLDLSEKMVEQDQSLHPGIHFQQGN
ncbi:MAG: methyltransferase domain-containing protein, partial [Candidatus Saccharibacteria bacterium]